MCVCLPAVLEEEVLTESQSIPYDPLLLDNPETQSENHRTVLTFRSYRVSHREYRVTGTQVIQGHAGPC